jgi:hypothetical protein
MQFTSQSASAAQSKSSSFFPGARKAEDVVYQAMTIAAILLVLGTAWVF